MQDNNRYKSYVYSGMRNFEPAYNHLNMVLKDVEDEKISEKIKDYLINPVEACEATWAKPQTLKDNFTVPQTVDILNGFINKNDQEISEVIKQYSLAMDFDDIKFLQSYFKKENKSPR